MTDNKLHKQKPIYIILGTRAQFIKMAPIIKRLENRKIIFDLIYTQQHIETIEDIIENFGIKTPLRYIVKRKQEAKTIKLFAGWGIQMLLIFLNPFSRRKAFRNGRGLVITHGDTATTTWAAVYARTSFCKVMHVESGLRSFNIFKPFPEEIMRLITFIFANYYICPNAWAMNNLKHFPGKKYNVGGNQMYDSLMFAIQQIENPNHHSLIKKFKLPEKYALVSIHRYENIFNKKTFNFIINLLNEEITKYVPLVFVLHPATEKRLKALLLYEKLETNPKIILIKRQDFLTFVEMTYRAEFVITDGGSNQEELSYTGKPTILFREVTERTEGLGKNIVLSKLDKNVIIDFVKNYKKYQKPPVLIPDSPSEKTIGIITSVIT